MTAPMVVGSNEKYILSKIKSYNIKLSKVDEYLAKLENDFT